MRTGLIAKKIGNSSFYSKEGKSTNVTLLKIEECIVSNIKTVEKDGYNAIQLASIDTNKDVKKLKKPQRKNFTSINIKPKKILKEFKVDSENILEIGTTLDVNHFKIDQFVDVSGKSIGKGFAGVMKRHTSAG